MRLSRIHIGTDILRKIIGLYPTKGCNAATFFMIIFVQQNFSKLKKKRMKKSVFKFLAKVNKAVLPSYSKKQLDLSKATKFELAIIGWRYYVTTNAIA